MPRRDRRAPELSAIGVLAAILCIAHGAAAQEMPTPSFRSDVVQGIVHVVVLDRSGRAVDDLPSEAFSLQIDGEPVPVKVFLPPAATSLELALLLDHSFSLASRPEQVRAGIERLLDGLRPDDCVDLLPFADVPGLWVRGHPDSEAIRRVVRGVYFDGDTALYDSLLEALAHLEILKLDLQRVPVVPAGLYGFRPLLERMARQLGEVAPEPCASSSEMGGRRFVLAVVTDGVDTASRQSLDDVLVGAATANVPVLIVVPRHMSNNERFDLRRQFRRRHWRSIPEGSVLRPLPQGDPADHLRRLALASGGALFQAESLDEAYTVVLQGLQGHYMLGYPVAAAGDSGELVPRGVRVDVDRSGVQVFHQVSTYSNRLVGEASAAAAMLRGLAVVASYPDAALEDFDEALRADPRLAAAHHGRGLALRALGEPEPAAEAFRTAIALAPWLAGPHRALADLALAQSDAATSWEHTIRAVHLDPRNRDLLARMAALVPPPADLASRLDVPLLLLRAPLASDLRGQTVGVEALARIAVRIQRSQSFGVTSVPEAAILALEIEVDPRDPDHPQAVSGTVRLFDTDWKERVSAQLQIAEGFDGASAGAALDRLVARLLEDAGRLGTVR